MRCKLLSTALLVLGAATCGQPASPDSPSEPGPSLAQPIEQALPPYLAPEQPAPSSKYGQIRKMLQAGQVDDALALLEREYQQDPSGEAAFLAGWTQYGQKRYALAAPFLLRAVESGPGYPQAEHAFFLLGRCLQERGSLAAAQAAFEADTHLRPGEGQSPFRLAQIAFEQNQLERCEALTRKALALFKRPQDLAKSHALLADVHLARDADGLAREALETCVGIFPHYEAYYRLSQLCRLEGDEDQADRYLALHQQGRARAGR